MTQSNQLGLLDAELLSYLKNDLVEKLQIRENEKSRYEVHAILKLNTGILPVMTTRGKNREWASLDRLVKHFKLNKIPVRIDWYLHITASRKENHAA